MNKRIKKKKLKGGVQMRTLEEIRQKNKRKDLLLDGMESVPVSIPHDLKDYEGKIYNDFIKPHVKNFFEKHLKDGHL